MTRILIVADSPTQIEELAQVLTRHGHEVLTAESGQAGVDTARQELPDAVLMDIVMPGLNGFQATRQLTSDPLTSAIPVVILTSKDQETDRLWGQRQGASGYLTKPIDERLLMKTLDEVVNS